MKWCLPIVLVVMLAGCGQPQNTNADSVQTTAIISSAPPTETTGNEPPQSPEPTQVSLPLPGLPVGGNADLTQADPTVQCVFVSWSGPPDVPPGVVVSVTKIQTTPADAFELVSADCGGGHLSCGDHSFHLTSGGPTCALALKFTGRPAGDDPRLSFAAGVVTCPIAAAHECQAFVDAVSHADQRSIQLRQPDLAPPTATG